MKKTAPNKKKSHQKSINKNKSSRASPKIELAAQPPQTAARPKWRQTLSHGFLVSLHLLAAPIMAHCFIDFLWPVLRIYLENLPQA
jgi:hypothetical protein